MDTLLVCTDFSEPASHAASYACMLAQQNKLSYITLFHASHPIITSTTLPLNPDEEHEQAKASLQQLKTLKEQLELQADDSVMIRIRTEQMSLDESINNLCREENADMVVMGATGKSKFEKALIGSNTITVSQNSKYPVLIVPVKAPLKPVSHILFACKLDEVKTITPLDALDKVLELFKANLTVLNVDKGNRHFSLQTPEEMYQMHHIFDKYKPRYAYTDNKDITEGILKYAEKNNISLIVTIPGNYNFFQRLFHKSTTQKLIYQSDIPLLILHEK